MKVDRVRDEVLILKYSTKILTNNDIYYVDSDIIQIPVRFAVISASDFICEFRRRQQFGHTLARFHRR
jgi:hypothetical protein